jgi:hypothetical protein
MGTPSTAYPSAKAIAELAREAQLQQLQGLDSLDTKSASLIGLSGVLLGLIFTSSVATDRWSLALSIGAGLIGVSIVFLALGLLPRTSRFNPNILALAPAYMGKSEEETYYVTTASIEQALVHNANLTKWKANLLRMGISLAVVGLVFITGGLIYAAEKGSAATPTKRTTTATIHSGWGRGAVAGQPTREKGILQ